MVITEDISAVMANQSDLAVPIQKLQTISVRNQIHIQDEVSALPLIVDDVRNPKDAQRQVYEIIHVFHNCVRKEVFYRRHNKF